MIGGNTFHGWLVGARRAGAAMEPADDRREHGSQNLSRLTCPNPSSRERSMEQDPVVSTMDLSKCRKCSLTCMRALSGSGVTTWALAAQMMTALDVGSFS